MLRGFLLNKNLAPQGAKQGLIEMLSGAGALITGTVSTSVSAVGAAVAFVMSRVAMFLATVAVWAGARGPRRLFLRVVRARKGCRH